jgi:putative tributyrin esterase
MSMGGYGAIYAALERPQQYAMVAAYSGLLDIMERYEKPQGLDLYPVFGTKEELVSDEYDLFEKATKKSTQFDVGKTIENVDSSTEFLITCGLQDPRYHMSENFYKHIKKLGYKTVCSWEEGEHNWEYWNCCIKQTIKLIESRK